MGLQRLAKICKLIGMHYFRLKVQIPKIGNEIKASFDKGSWKTINQTFRNLEKTVFSKIDKSAYGPMHAPHKIPDQITKPIL